jgi:chromatin remodeling complex protein RSC6
MAKKKAAKKGGSKSSKKSSKKAAPKKKAAKKKSARKPNPAFMKALTPSPALAAVVGSKAMPRTEVVKSLGIH